MPSQIYNKTLKSGHGTLIGNWQEEMSLRETDGASDSNCYSRSFQDGSDTFRRIHGSRRYDPLDQFTTTNMEFSKKVTAATGMSGSPRASCPHTMRDRIDTVVNDTLARMDPSLRPRYEALQKENYFEALKERAEQLDRMEKRIEFGPFPGMTEAGDAFRQPAVTELASDSLPTQRQRENLASTGCPIMHGAENPCAPSSDAVPKACPVRPVTLMEVQKRIQDALQESLGGCSYVLFRKFLMAHQNAAGNVSTRALCQFLKEPVGVKDEIVAPNVLDAALKVLSTTDKGTVPAAKLVEFFWPPLSQQRKALLENLSREVKKLTEIARARGLPMPVVDVSCLSPDLQKIVSCGPHEHDGQGGVSPQDMNNLLLMLFCSRRVKR